MTFQTWALWRSASFVRGELDKKRAATTKMLNFQVKLGSRHLVTTCTTKASSSSVAATAAALVAVGGAPWPPPMGSHLNGVAGPVR